MHVYFSGIGGMGIGPLSLIAHNAGYTVSGSDKQESSYLRYLQKQGISNIHIGQEYDQIAAVHARNPIDWLVFSSAVAKEQSDAPELQFCRKNGIKATKRDVFLSQFIADKQLKLVAVAGTHGKTTTTAMVIWLFNQLGLPESHSVGAKMSFADMGAFDPDSKYFLYEADEYDRNFLAFHPHLAIITGVDWDHPDIFPTRQDYLHAFQQFLDQSQAAIAWDADLRQLGIPADENHIAIHETDPAINESLHLPGQVNRQDAWEVAQAVAHLTGKPVAELLPILNRFPGVARRFEQIIPNIFSDYAHTPPKIRGALQMAHEAAGDNVVVVYEGLHNTRQHFIKDELKTLFDSVKKLYIVPSYLAREDKSMALLKPADLRNLLTPATQERTQPSALDGELETAIRRHAEDGDLVLCITAGGGGSLDEWLRKTLLPA